MNYLTVTYLFFFLPLTVLIYKLIPKKRKWLILLIASYIFFFLISNKLLIFLLLITLLIYISGLGLEKIELKYKDILGNKSVEEKKQIKLKCKKEKKLVLLFSLLGLIGILFFYKYLPFFKININYILSWIGIDYQFEIIKIIAPIGLSFYTLEAISYLVDVYNKKIEADHNLGRLALFLAFFPQIMEGPIARYNETANSLYEGNPITYENFCFGYQRIFWGVLKKMVIADRLNALVKLVFDGSVIYNGGIVFFGALCYTIMLYMEFSGTMDVIIGSGEIFGVKLPENFRQPFFSKNVSDFWTRWHITLGTWFKDYIFYPISLSKPMKKLTINARKKLGNHFGPLIAGSIALLVVWFLNGLWHGAGWHYIFFGLYQFIFILAGNILEPIVRNICAKYKINRENIIYRIFVFIKLTIIIVIGELFFRANSLEQGFALLNSIITSFTLKSFFNGEILNFGVDRGDFLIVFITLIIVFIVGVIREKGINIRKWIASKNIVIRWIIYFALLLFIIVFGAYGPGYAQIDPIYADF